MPPQPCARQVLLASALAFGLLPAHLRGQARDTGYTALRWWHPVAASAGIAALFAVDRPIRDYIQDHRSATLDDVGDVAARFHHKNVILVSGTGAMAVGLLVREPEVAQTGLQILTSYGLVSGMMIGTKWIFGRSRPSMTPDDNMEFGMFAGGEDSAFPSGASSVTFSLATTLSDAIGHPAATVVLYSGATLNAWARVNADRHWLSDVALGAVYGVTAAKLVNGRWRIFGLRPPTMGIDANGRTSLRYSLDW